MGNFWALVKAIPEVLKAIRAFFGAIALWNLNAKKKQTETAMEKVENAKTTEEKQNALDDVSNRLGGN